MVGAQLVDGDMALRRPEEVARLLPEAAFGNSILVRQVVIVFGLMPQPAAFRIAPGQAERWQAYCTAVEACGADPTRSAAMCAAATATFEAFEAWLENWAA
jgi:heme oxygenase